ncbi:MAG TPA: STAS domain-containing protein [Pseudomonadota bacterium]|nr:STAS domain-containing protein [Pseudomonadota bacterium]
MRCERCCLEDPACDALDADAFARKLSGCDSCPLLQGTSPIPATVLSKQLQRIKESARLLRHKQNRIRQLEHAQKELTQDILRSDERVSKLERTQHAIAQAAEAQLTSYLRMLESQQESIVALSTPIIQVWDAVLVLPLIGHLDASRLQTLTENLLASLQQHKARFAILDLTGISELDAASAGRLLKVAQAVGLLGATALLCGLRPQVVRTVTSLGVDLGELSVTRTLKEALGHCIARVD